LVRGILFDLDGTLADTLPVSFAAFRAVLRAATGRTLTNAEILGRFGPSERGVFAGLLPERHVDAAYVAFLERYRREHRRCRRPFDGIVGALEELRTAGMRMAVVTGKGPDSAAISLDTLGLTPYFEFVEAGSDEGAAKPACMRRVLDAWGLPASEAVAIGDSPSDARAAAEAGVAAFGAAWAPHVVPERLRSAGVAELFHRVDEWTSWLRRAGRRD
jgi:phosphoglycolate phosphatase-like HAD superfamily hydrolase